MRPCPVVDDPDTRGFWEAARRGQVAVCYCRSCDASVHLPGPYCMACGSWDIGWREVAGNGTVYSFTVVEQAIHPAFPAPYTVVLVELDAAPGVRLLGYLEGRAGVAIGTPMTVTFTELEGGVVIPGWVPVEG